MILEKVDQKFSNFKTRIKSPKFNPVWKQPEVIHYFETLKFVFAPIDKASNNFAIIYKK